MLGMGTAAHTAFAVFVCFFIRCFVLRLPAVFVLGLTTVGVPSAGKIPAEYFDHFSPRQPTKSVPALMSLCYTI